VASGSVARGRRLSAPISPSPLHPLASCRNKFRVVLAMAGMIAFGLATVLAVPPARTSSLRALGRALTAEAPLAPADVVVVTPDSNGAGALEAADLVKAGISGRVAVFDDPPDDIDLEFLRRGLPYEDGAARFERQLRSLEVTKIERIPRGVAGTEDEGRVLPEWCDRQQLVSVIVVTTWDHSRRLSRVLQRAMVGHRTEVRVRAARHSNFDPDRWWQSRRGLRTGIVEIEKLLLDVVRHPFS
jgi:hypothetical protein